MGAPREPPASACRAGAVAAALRQVGPTTCPTSSCAPTAGFKDLADTFGGTIAYSTEHSHSGYNAPRFHLLPHRTAARPQLYSTVLGPFIRQRPVIDAVLDGRADVAAVDGYGLDLLRRHEPALVARLRIVATTVPAPAPPLVASPGIDVATRERVTAALLSVHEAPAMATTLDELLLARFVRVEPEIFEIFLERERAAEPPATRSSARRRDTLRALRRSQLNRSSRLDG